MKRVCRFLWLFVYSLLSCALLAGCAGSRPGPVATTPEPSPEELARAEEARRREIARLYTNLDTARQRYEGAIATIESGNEVGGEAALVQASNALSAGSARCAATEGCDLQRFFATFEILLNRQNIALKSQVSRAEALEASAAAAEQLEREPGTSPFVATMPQIGRTVSLLRGTDLRDIIALNGPVKAALDDWLTWMRPLLISAWVNYQFLRDEVAPVYEEAHLPEALLFAMLATETGGKVHSYSRAGAAGPLQFMRHTGRRYGLTVVDGFDMRLDPVAATRANVAYLNDQFKVLNNDLEKALAAYNGGENRMASLQRRLGDVSLWDTRWYFALPSETREYVPRILAAAWLFLHPEDYNLEFPIYDTAVTEMSVHEDIALGELTICLGQAGDNPNGWFRTLRNLNPRLDPGDRIPSGGSVRIPTVLVPVYERECIEGEHLDLARELYEANYTEPKMIPYIVRSGDTLGRIAGRHRCVSVRELAALNNIRPPRYVIRVGQQLKIPNCG